MYSLHIALSLLPLLALQVQSFEVGILVFPKLTTLDAFGPRRLFAFVPNLTVSFVAETKELVAINTDIFTGPAYTFDEDPPLDALLIPGGPGTGVEYNNPVLIDYLKRTYPKLQYIMSVCTGAQLLAKAGVLDGKNATTNKVAWWEITASGPKVNWIAKARWVVHDNIWTSSGVAAGMDMTHTFIKTVFQNETLADYAANFIEYEPHRDPSWDPYADIWGAKDVAPQVA